MDRRRRAVLRSLGGLGVAGVAGLAGCAGLPNPFGSEGTSFTDLSAPEDPPPDYREWLPAPTALPGGYSLQVATPARIGRLGDAVPSTFGWHGRLIGAELDYVGVGFENYEWAVSAGSGTVAAADVDREAVAATLADTGYEPAGEHRGVDLYAREDGPRTVGVGEGHLLFAREWSGSGQEDAEPLAPDAVVRRFTDAGRGERPRIHEVDPVFARLSSAFGTPPVGLVQPGGTGTFFAHPGDRGWGLSVDGAASGWTFDADAAYLRTVLALGTDNPAATQRIRNRVESSESFDPYRTAEVRTEGRLGYVLARVGDDRYDRLFGGSERPDYPQITWGYDHDPDAGTITVTHEAGTTAPGESLVVSTVGGERRSFGDEHRTVGPGDSLTVRAGRGDLGVRWIPGSSGVTLKIGGYEVP